MHIYFYTKPDCTLCDEGQSRAEMAVEETGASMTVRSIEDREEWLERYHLSVPVVTDTEGNVLQEGMVFYGELLAQLKER
ncbi:glutaredoxin family protein [Alkalicoccus urumqiensis]|uniref:Glutaredoxin family protein n=1 Tax=Alkalicoccus urumqiensis TaxID=1548213 RepID=A0A2P6MH09_ALKUR|nr:glutaredoxin family protein [Alkalicoccus urumqiensis]PRO65575.1 hypothetical protein C6I21_08600 [Alkalicoccus urumqiensis]